MKQGFVTNTTAGIILSGCSWWIQCWAYETKAEARCEFTSAANCECHCQNVSHGSHQRIKIKIWLCGGVQSIHCCLWFDHSLSYSCLLYWVRISLQPLSTWSSYRDLHSGMWPNNINIVHINQNKMLLRFLTHWKCLQFMTRYKTEKRQRVRK